MGGKAIKGISVNKSNSTDPISNRAKATQQEVEEHQNDGDEGQRISSRKLDIKTKESPRFSGVKSSPKNVIKPSLDYRSSITKESAFNPQRMSAKKQKIHAKNSNNKVSSSGERTEVEVLQVIKKNNYEYTDYDLINECLIKHFFMRCLEKDARNEIIKEMTLCKVDQGVTVFRQGAIGNYFYIVQKGELELFINDSSIKSFFVGDNFGELALLHGAKRSGTVITKSECHLWCMERRNFRKIVDHVNQINFEENKKFLGTIPILGNIENDLKSILASNLIKEHYEEGKYIVKEGEIASCLFIIKEGEVLCSQRGKLIRTLNKGDHFGEISILLESTRTLDVIAKTSCVIYSISVETLKKMVGERYKDILFLNFIKMSFTKSIKMFKINMKLLESAYECFSVKSFEKGEVVIPMNYHVASKIIIVIEGNIVNKKINQIVAKRGGILFEEAVCKMSMDEKVRHELIADPDCLIVEAPTEAFMKFLGGSLKDVLKKSNALDSINKIPLFKNFTQKKLETLSSLLHIEKYENGKKIITQGETDFRFFIIKSGKVDIFIDSNYIRTLNEFEFFGERALFFNEPRTATAQAQGKVELFVLEAKDFKSILEENLSNYLRARFFLQDNTIELKDLDFIKELGSGNFGAVCLVKSRKNKHNYAIKSMSKKQIDVELLHKNLELERGILLKIDHPFIVKLVKAMKNDKNIFFLMEYIKGKELFDAIRDIGLLNKLQTQFYGCSMMLAIEYLHERKIVYRDIKPENIMVLENGYLKLIDFGTAKEITDRTATIIGTPHYMAPEVILGEGYGLQVDYWSIAICIYEFLCGGVPYGENAEDPMDVYLAIINDELKFPGFLKDKELRSLLLQMLSKSPLNRLCKLSHIKTDPWFKGFNWEALISLDVEPPHIPKISSKDDDSKSYPYVNYLKNTKEWISPKDAKIDPKQQVEYDLWFKNF